MDFDKLHICSDSLIELIGRERNFSICTLFILLFKNSLKLFVTKDENLIPDFYKTKLKEMSVLLNPTFMVLFC